MVKIKIDDKEETIYNVKELNDLLKPCGEIVSRGRNPKHRRRYKEEFITFDIETTTIIPESYKCDPEQTDERPYAFMYLWQLCIGNSVIMGRTWGEFLNAMNIINKFYKLNDNCRMVVYVHNLAYEMVFLQSFINIENLFAKDLRKPLTFSWNGFEFRCSWMLSNMSLSKFCEHSKLCVHKKKDGELYDYSKIRTPKTELTEYELGYAFNDVKGLHECIEDRLQDDNLCSIPLTSTGYVRRYARRQMAKNGKNRGLFVHTRLDLDQYFLIKDIFRGGDTHASRFYCDMKLKNLVSYDIKSSYPYVMMFDYFPISKLYPYEYKGNKKEFEEMCGKYCVMFEVEIWGLKPRGEICDPYIDTGHVKERRKLRDDNGRVIAADYVKISITEIDWKIINQKYKMEEWNVKRCYYAKRGLLPEELRDTVFYYFTQKTLLDGDPNKYYEYMKKKSELNALFGMLVTDIIHDDYILVNGRWKIQGEYDTEEVKRKRYQKKLDDYYNSRSNFLPYQYGIYVTAHARKHLNTVRSFIGNDTVYWDTDSVKFFAKPEYIKFINEYNDKIIKRGMYAKTPEGEKKYLGVFEKDGEYIGFKTLGAKKYCYIDKKGVHITVAGMGKEAGRKSLIKKYREHHHYRGEKEILDFFEIGETFENVGRTKAYYHDNTEIRTIEVEGVEIVTGANVGLENGDYTLGVTGEYWEVILTERMKGA